MCAEILRESSSNFYPRPPRGGRHKGGHVGGLFVLFLSTPSARRATNELFNGGQTLVISIHALREEGDLLYMVDVAQVIEFLSTPSARRATVDGVIFCPVLVISIHALREEGDLVLVGVCVNRCKISIHALREEGDQTAATRFLSLCSFLSTPSARRATKTLFHALL